MTFFFPVAVVLAGALGLIDLNVTDLFPFWVTAFSVLGVFYVFVVVWYTLEVLHIVPRGDRWVLLENARFANVWTLL